MRELLLVFAILVLLTLGGAAVFLPIEGLMEIGGWMIALGFVFGIPTGLVYHVILRRAALRAGTLTAGWYWRPTSFHNKVSIEDQRSFRPWFYAAASGWVVIVLGIILLVTGMGRGLVG